MLVAQFRSNTPPAELAHHLRFHTTEQVRFRQAKASRRAQGLRRLSLLCGVAAAGMSAGTAVFVNYWLGAAVALTLGAAIGYGLKKSRRYAAYAHMLEPLSPEQYRLLKGLASASDVVKVVIEQAAKARRTLCQADLTYARTLVVRESRSGAKASDHLPLEQTRGLLAPGV